MLKLLKKYGADLTIQDNEALCLASQNGYFDCVEQLFTKDINIENFKYTTSYKNLCKYQKSN